MTIIAGSLTWTWNKTGAKLQPTGVVRAISKYCSSHWDQRVACHCSVTSPLLTDAVTLCYVVVIYVGVYTTWFCDYSAKITPHTSTWSHLLLVQTHGMEKKKGHMAETCGWEMPGSWLETRTSLSSWSSEFCIRGHMWSLTICTQDLCCCCQGPQEMRLIFNVPHAQ
jgi:hypothetical protein